MHPPDLNGANSFVGAFLLEKTEYLRFMRVNDYVGWHFVHHDDKLTEERVLFPV